MIQAVLFDMDGLMIDSEPLHYQAFNSVFQKYGKSFTQKEFNDLYLGITDIEDAKDMVPRYGFTIPPEQLVKEAQEKYRDILQNTIATAAQPGLFELLKKLKENNIKMAIASGSTPEEINMVITGLDISEYISTFCSAYEVAKGKPAPDVFLEAAKRLGVAPENCLVLEDAPAGVEGAKAAGMQCFVVPTEETKDKDFSEATKVLGSLSEVFENLRN